MAGTPSGSKTASKKTSGSAFGGKPSNKIGNKTKKGKQVKQGC